MAAAAAMVGGGLISAYGQYQQGLAGKQAGEFNAQMAEQNAELAQQQAKEDERRIRAIGLKQMGDTRASTGANGLQMDGSALDVLQDTAQKVSLDALYARHRGEVQAVMYRNQARLDRYQGEAALTGAQYGAAASILSAGGQAAYYGKRG